MAALVCLSYVWATSAGNARMWYAPKGSLAIARNPKASIVMICRIRGRIK